MSVNRKRNVRGIAVLEIILAVAAVGAMLSFYLKLADKQLNEQRGRAEVENETTFQQLALQYFTANRTAMIAAMGSATVTADVTAHCAVKVTNTANPIVPGTSAGAAGANGTLAWSATKHTCAFDTSFLRAKSIWPTDVLSSQDPDMGGEWRYAAVFRRTSSGATLTENVEMLVVRMDMDGTLPSGLTADHWTKDTARKQAAEAGRKARGSAGGSMPIGNVGWCSSTKSQTEICGNGWKANLSNFIDDTQLAALRDKLPN